MQNKTATALRSVLSTDETIPPEDIRRAISIISGNPLCRCDFVRIIKISDAAKMLGVTPSGIHDYVRRGLLTKVVGINNVALGIRSDSLENFRLRKVERKAQVSYVR